MEDEEKKEERVEVVDFKKRAIRHCSAREKAAWTSANWFEITVEGYREGKWRTQ
jgi:hypothetical protein